MFYIPLRESEYHAVLMHGLYEGWRGRTYRLKEPCVDHSSTDTLMKMWLGWEPSSWIIGGHGASSEDINTSGFTLTIMSFGFGVGDFIAVGTLTWKVYRLCKAPAALTTIKASRVLSAPEWYHFRPKAR